MAEQGLPSSIRGVLRRLKVKELKHLADAELLDRYIATRDEAAFTALVGRHGPTVLNVCRRVLRGHDVDDVFQATFLALAREASHIRRREALGAWLYEVAYHAALRAKNRTVRNQQVEQAAAKANNSTNSDEVVCRDMQQVLDEELHQLPERLRKPLVMVHLLGQVQVDAARELGITDRALRKRLRIGRERLRVGLTRRGVRLTTAAFAVALDQAATAGPVAPGLLGPTVDSVLAYAAGQTAAVPAATVSLAMVGVGGWLAGPFKLIALVAIPMLATLAITAAAALAPSRPTAIRPDEPLAANAEPDQLPIITASRPGGKMAVVSGRILDTDGRPVPGAAVTGLVRRPWQSDDRGLHDQVVARGIADAEGRYSLIVPADFPTWSSERRLTLLADAAGHGSVIGAAPLADPPGSTDLRLVATATVTGRLLTPEGGPAAGVTVAVVRIGKIAWQTPQGARSVPPPRGWPRDVMTDATGSFRLNGVPAGETVWLQVRDDRFALTTFSASAEHPSAAGPAKPPEPVVLAGPRLLRGRITASDTGRPLSGARLALVAGSERQAIDYYSALATRLWTQNEPGPEMPSAEIEGVTDTDGHYQLALPPSAAYQAYVYPPVGEQYVGWHWSFTWSEGETTRERSAALPPGVEVQGRVVEEDGRPVSGACVLWSGDPNAYPPPAPPKSLSIGPGEPGPMETMLFSNVASLSAADGRFRIVVSRHRIMLRVYGPTAEYQLCGYGYERCPQCGKEHLRPGEHARVAFDATAGPPEPVSVTLRRGWTVVGSAVGPDGEPVRDGVLICRNVDLPLRKPAPRPLPIRDGKFVLPGCVPDRVYPMLLLDAAHDLAAVAEVQIGQPMSTVRLERCGSASVRLTDSAGRPIAGERATAWFWLPDDRPAGLDAHGGGPWSNAMDASWVNPRRFLPGLLTGPDGVVTLLGLVPGLQYQLKFGDRAGPAANSVPFRVLAGHAGRLPDVVVPDPPPAGHPIEKPPEAPSR